MCISKASTVTRYTDVLSQAAQHLTRSSDGKTTSTDTSSGVANGLEKEKAKSVQNPKSRKNKVRGKRI